MQYVGRAHGSQLQQSCAACHSERLSIFAEPMIMSVFTVQAGPSFDYSPFHIFALVFPSITGPEGSGRGNRRMRLHFNKIGYTLYRKEQSRRVPSHAAKPGNPGYGFRRARWRDTLLDSDDGLHCETMLRSIGLNEVQINRTKHLVQEFAVAWEQERRGLHPAGPGRPAGPRKTDPEPAKQPVDCRNDCSGSPARVYGTGIDLRTLLN